MKESGKMWTLMTGINGYRVPRLVVRKKDKGSARSGRPSSVPRMTRNRGVLMPRGNSRSMGWSPGTR